MAAVHPKGDVDVRKSGAVNCTRAPEEQVELLQQEVNADHQEEQNADDDQLLLSDVQDHLQVLVIDRFPLRLLRTTTAEHVSEHAAALALSAALSAASALAALAGELLRELAEHIVDLTERIVIDRTTAFFPAGINKPRQRHKQGHHDEHLHRRETNLHLSADIVAHQIPRTPQQLPQRIRK